MASPPLSEASEIRRRGRQRLIGAIALVAILVVFVPMLLDSDPRPPRNEPSLAIPPKASAPPLPAPPKAERAAAPAPTAEPPKAVKAPEKSAKAAAPRLEGFAVQVGAFREDDKLDQARQKLAAAKVPHYTERLEAKAGPLTRLRAGPFATREAAEAALATIKLSALDGKVVPLP